MHTLGPEYNILALNLQGDIGPITFYTSSRGKMVAFLRAPPLNPPTAKQETIRDIFRNAASQWRALTPGQRTEWQQVADRCNLGITGYNLFTWYSHKRHYPGIQPLEEKARITLTLPP